MPDTPIYSIIVPLYNVEPYLLKCLKSISNQSYESYEVILIYDSSIDKTYELCEDFIKKNKKFKLFIGPNKGAGAARNYGVKLARGDLICFVDSDDWIEPDLCSDMYRYFMDSDVQFANYGFNFTDITGKVLISKHLFHNKCITGDNIFKMGMLDVDIYTVVWNKIYRKKFLIENGILFPEVKEWEDILYSRKVAYYGKKTVFVSKVYYHALVRNNSRSRNISKSFLIEGLSLLHLEHEFINSVSRNNKYENLFRAHFIKHISFFLIKAAFQVQNNNEYLECFKYIYTTKYNSYLREGEVIKLLSKKNRLSLQMIKNPKILRHISTIIKKAGITPY